MNNESSRGSLQKAGGKGDNLVSTAGIIALAFYLILFSIFLLHATVQLWPVAGPSGKPAVPAEKPAIPQTTAEQVEPSATEANKTEAPKEVAPGKEAVTAESFQIKLAFFKAFPVSDEVRLLLIVIMTGALGALVHAIRSFYKYVGNQALKYSWIAMYGLLPFAGSLLAVLFYLVIRGGFFSPQSGSQQTSPFGFAAMAGLVGMFSEPAVLKLKDVAEQLFKKAEQGADPLKPADATKQEGAEQNVVPAGEATPKGTQKASSSTGESIDK